MAIFGNTLTKTKMGNCVWKVKPEDRLCRFCKYWHCEDRPKGNRNKYDDPVYHKLIEMPVGSWMFFPLEKWNLARATASKLKEEYGCVFSGNRAGD